MELVHILFDWIFHKNLHTSVMYYRINDWAGPCIYKVEIPDNQPPPTAGVFDLGTLAAATALLLIPSSLSTRVPEAGL